MRDITLSSVMADVLTDIQVVNASFGLIVSCPVECRQHDMVLRAIVALIDSGGIGDDVAMSRVDGPNHAVAAAPSADVVHRLVFHGAAAGMTESGVA